MERTKIPSQKSTDVLQTYFNNTKENIFRASVNKKRFYKLGLGKQNGGVQDPALLVLEIGCLENRNW